MKSTNDLIISDTDKIENIPQETIIENEDKKERINLKNKKLIFFSVIILVAVLLYSILNLNNFEKFAIRNTQTLQSQLRDPNSIVLYDDVIVYHCKNKILNYNGIFTYINFGAMNSFGDIVKDIAIFKDRKYLGTLGECNELSWGENLTDEEKEKILSLKEGAISYYLFPLAKQCNSTTDPEIKKMQEDSGFKGHQKYKIVKKEKIEKYLKTY